MDPLPTGVEPQLRKLEDIKACIFDIYGTLLISSSGDVEESVLSENNIVASLNEGNAKIKNEQRFLGGHAAREILKDFQNTIRKTHKQNKKNRILYPEIDICKIWSEVLNLAVERGDIILPDDFDIKKMVFVFEILSNRVYKMPGMKTVINTINKHNKALGIISNAQFYTPIIMNYYINSSAIDSSHICPFDPDLSIFSYLELKAKPDIGLFHKIIPVLDQKYNIQPEDVLFIGNDMLKDITPATNAGFKTALFAGDKRSLRMRENREEVRGIKPDVVITSLDQLLEVLF